MKIDDPKPSSNTSFPLAFDGQDKNLEMSRYIDLDLYHKVERSHPYYVEMIEEIRGSLSELREGATVSLLELGAGTGLATIELLSLGGVDVDALEIDESCCELLAKYTNQRARCICGDATVYCKPNAYDFVVSVFAHDHIHYDQAQVFSRNIRNNLKPGGYYIMGGELLPNFESDEQRIDALQRYHGFIVAKALRNCDFELAQIEINALKSGVRKIGDFKRHELQFEQEMLSAGFSLIKKTKMGPAELDDVGGVFVYVFRVI